MKRLIISGIVVAAFALGYWTGKSGNSDLMRTAAADAGRVFEIRTYTTNEGKLDALHARFREHTMKLFEKHGMTNIGYWTPEDAPLSGNTLIYILEHPSREAAKQNWEAFGKDAEWQRVKQESEANGAIVKKVESVFVEATDYSPMK